MLFAWACVLGQESSERHLELGVHGGYAFTSMNDVNEGIESMSNAGMDLKEVTGGFCFGGCFHYPLSARYALFLGLDYVSAKTNSTIRIHYTSEDSPEILSLLDMKHLISCSLIAVQTGIAHQQLFGSWKLYLKGAVNYYHAALHLSGTAHASQELMRDVNYEHKTGANGFGLVASVSPVYPISEKWSITGEAGYRLARISNFDSNYVSNKFLLDFSGLFFNAGLLFAL
jgi:hypothetical protein